MEYGIKKRLGNALQNPAWICFVWFGMTAGISLLATPARFAAPTVTRIVALDIGRVVFAVLNKAELMALIIFLIVIRASDHSRRWWAVAALLTLIVLAQSIWLLPELAERTAQIVAGGQPPPSIAHAAYSSLELIKLGLLFCSGMVALSSNAASQDRPLTL